MDAPSWQAPPRGELGVFVAERLVLVGAGDVVMAVAGFTVYRSGVLFELAAVAAEGDLPDEGGAQTVAGDGASRLRFEVEDARGAVVRDRDFIELIRSGCADDAPGGGLLWPRGGSSGAGSVRLLWWLWPLPAAGPLRIRASWPAAGVEPCEAVLDAGRLLDVVPGVRKVWGEDSA